MNVTNHQIFAARPRFLTQRKKNSSNSTLPGGFRCDGHVVPLQNGGDRCVLRGSNKTHNAFTPYPSPATNLRSVPGEGSPVRASKESTSASSDVSGNQSPAGFNVAHKFVGHGDRGVGEAEVGVLAVGVGELRQPQGEIAGAAHGAPVAAGPELAGYAVGPCVLVTFPGEPTVQIGLNIKQKSPHKLTFVAGCTNGYIYYAPTEEQLRNRGWAQEDCDCLVGPGWQARFESKAAEILGKL
jgi:hypothetical protein